MSDIKVKGTGANHPESMPKAPGASASAMAGSEDKVARVLKAANALRARNYGGNQKNQCANFVRQAFTDAGFKLPSAARPSDYALVVQKLGPNQFGPTLADSLAGDEIGPKVALGDAQAGDIVL
ncbi:MAG: hypothetical protein ABI824_01290, partial [Acidobacteriota bacterium]